MSLCIVCQYWKSILLDFVIVSSEACYNCYRWFVVNRNSSAALSEIQTMAENLTKSQIDEIQSAFETFDKDHDGLITMQARSVFSIISSYKKRWG